MTEFSVEGEEPSKNNTFISCSYSMVKILVALGQSLYAAVSGLCGLAEAMTTE
jgi:hypothetical protein